MKNKEIVFTKKDLQKLFDMLIKFCEVTPEKEQKIYQSVIDKVCKLSDL